MTPLDINILPLGAVVEDSSGREWVYVGFSSRGRDLPPVHRFVMGSNGGPLATPPWVYDVVNTETMIKKFPNVTQHLEPSK
jgi:hypothetical protein